jgi:RNA polymerase sigma-70 factor (ECF subfamily)
VTNSSSQPTDFELLDAWKGGDLEAADQLLRRHFETVFRFFRNKVDTGIEDLVQKTFVACVEARDRFRSDASFRVFLLAIARYQLLNFYRKRRRSKEVLDDDADGHHEQGASPSAVMADHQEQRLLLRALRRLEPELQIILELSYWENLKVEEMAMVLEIPGGTVKSRLFRARKQLREQLAALASEQDVLKSTTDNLDQWARSLRGLLGRTRS